MSSITSQFQTNLFSAIPLMGKDLVFGTFAIVYNLDNILVSQSCNFQSQITLFMPTTNLGKKPDI